jgi:ABC-type nickel/cobalt efflux system permease component RcnA
MVVLGLVLLLAAAALVVLLVTAGTSPDVVMDLLGGQQLTTAPVWIFVAGAVALLLTELGLLLVARGTRRAASRRREIRRLREAAHTAEPADERDTSDTRTDGPVDDQPDRVLVRDADALHVHESTAGTGAAHRSPEEAADPQDAPHELRLDDVQTRGHRPSR